MFIIDNLLKKEYDTLRTEDHCALYGKKDVRWRSRLHDCKIIHQNEEDTPNCKAHFLIVVQEGEEVKVKKILSLTLSVALMFSLVACAGNANNGSGNSDNISTSDTSKSLNIEDAITETPRHIFKDVEANQAKAMQNTYLFEVVVGDITGEYFEGGNNSVTMSSTTYYVSTNVRVYLPVDQLAELTSGETVAIIGKITDVIKDSNQLTGTFVVFGEANLYDGEVAEVPPREDEIYTGLLKGKNDSYDGYWNIQIGDDPYLKLISFAEGEDLSAYNEAYNSGEEITFTAYMLGGAYQNAKIIAE